MTGDGGLRILVSVRSDAGSKPGGDVNLLATFADQLAERHRVEKVTGVPSVVSLRDHDLVVTANLDRPVEPAATLARAEQAGIPMVHYALHHPAAGVEAYLRHGVHGVRRQLGRLAGGSPVRYEQLLWTLHAGSDLVRHRRRPAVGSVRRAQQRLLDSARVVVSCEEEGMAIARDIGTPGPYDVVAHPADFPAGPHQPTAGRIVVPGRIESRKNQLLSLAVARRFPALRFLFVGGATRSDRRYVRLFNDELARTANATHIEHLPRDDFYPLILGAEAVLSASWFEVTSLIERYCVDNGVPLAASRYSYLDGPAVAPVERFDPADVDGATEALAACLAGPPRRIAAPGGVATVASRTIVDVVEGRS